MIEVGARQNCRAALRLRRISTGNDQVRPCAALDSRLAVGSPARRRRFCLSRSAGRVRHPLDRFPSKRSMHLTNRPASDKIPITFDARPRHISRGFLPWRLAYAGPGVRRATIMGPASANLHINGPEGPETRLPFHPQERTCP
jgi:hypothetical protein